MSRPPQVRASAFVWAGKPPGARGFRGLQLVQLLSRALARSQDPSKPLPADFVPCYDPGTLELLGDGKAHVDTPAEARALTRSPLRAQPTDRG